MSRRLANRAVIVNWPGADWQTLSLLLESDLMPNLRHLIEEGALATALPSLSQSAILSGSRGTPTGKFIWDLLAESDKRSIVVGWPEQPAARSIRGVSVSAEFFKAAVQGTSSPDAVFPEEFASRLARWCLRPAELTNNDLLPFVPAIGDIDLQDPRVRALASALVRTIGTHSVTTFLMESEPWDFLAVSYDLLDSIIIELARYRDFGPGDLFYQKACGAAYGFCDMMLGRIRQLAGHGATVVVVSAQGYRLIDALWPKKPYRKARGFFCMSSPGVKADELLNNASLLDLAPTILLTLGAPISPDMEGQPLTRAFQTDLHPDYAPA